MRPKTQNRKLLEMVGGRSGKLCNVPPDFLRQYGASAPITGDIWSASTKMRSRDRSEMNKNAPANPKSKVARNCRRKVQKAPQSPNRLLRSFRTDFGQYLVGIGNTGGGEDQAICCILVDFIFRFQLKYS